MKKIVIASNNPVKINATLFGFQKMFPDETFEIETVSVLSHVSEQPTSDAETYSGALHRSKNASQQKIDADFWIGIEGGVEEINSNMMAFAWIVIISKEQKIGTSRTGTFLLPPQVTQLLKQGYELGVADDIVFQRTNSKQEQGAVGLLTNNVIDRTKYYTEAIVLALIPFKNKALY